MAELFQFLNMTVGEDKLCARVQVLPGAPVRTSEDIEGTARVYYLAPGIAKHLCLGDSGREFQDCMGDTELAHLLEHLSVELMRQTDLAGDISCGRTRAVAGEDRVFDVELSCPDDALTVGCLSSAAFMMTWAYLSPESPAPDIEGTVEGMRHLVLGLRGEDDEDTDAVADEAAPADDAVADDEAAYPSEDARGRIFTEAARVAKDRAPVKRIADAARAVFGGAAANED